EDRNPSQHNRRGAAIRPIAPSPNRHVIACEEQWILLPNGSVAHANFWGTIPTLGIRHAKVNRLPNTRKSNFATEPRLLPRHATKILRQWREGKRGYTG